MSFLFLSPAFPPNAYLFCTALAARGVAVVAIGDEPLASLSAELRASLVEYVFEPNMADYDALLAAARGLASRHGSIDALDSVGEHWLDSEARLRDDLDVEGLRTAEVTTFRSKLGMAERFAAASLVSPAASRCTSAAAVRYFAATHGFPLVFKPDTGSGAVDTFSVATPAQLETVLADMRPDLIVQPFIEGTIVTFDGLVDRAGEIVFCMSHVYDRGIMQIRAQAADGYYYSTREIPSDLEDQGRRAVHAFGLKSRFFHVELFRRPDGTLVALEMNLRPPGGFTTDMMGVACDFDVYALWAACMTNAPFSGFAYERRFFVAHAGRRENVDYVVPLEALLASLGTTVVSVRAVPRAFAPTMGNTAFILRHADRHALLAAIHQVQRRV